jgi:hypothetical protein
MLLDVVFAAAVVVLAGLAVIGALTLVIVWEWCAIHRFLHAHRHQPPHQETGARRPGAGTAGAGTMGTTGRWLLGSWLVPALVLLSIGRRLPLLLVWATPSTLLVLGVGALIRQQRAPSFLDQPSLPYCYRVADDIGQPIAAVIAAAEQEATNTSSPTARGLRR